MLWHRAIARVATDFRLELDYLVTGWTDYALIGAGLRNAYPGWGLSLYLLGTILATQVAAVVGS